MKKLFALSLIMILLFSLISCGSKKSDFYTIYERMEQTDREFSQADTIFEDFKGGKDIQEGLDQVWSELYSVRKTIPLVKINGLYADAVLDRSVKQVFEDKDYNSNNLTLYFLPENNKDLTLAEIEEKVSEFLKADFPDLKFDANTFERKSYEDYSVTAGKSVIFLYSSEEFGVQLGISTYLDNMPLGEETEKNP